MQLRRNRRRPRRRPLLLFLAPLFLLLASVAWISCPGDLREAEPPLGPLGDAGDAPEGSMERSDPDAEALEAFADADAVGMGGALGLASESQTGWERLVPIEAEATTWEGLAIPLHSEGEPALIEPSSRFRLFSDRALVDLRIRLLDEDGKLVPSRDRAEVGAGTNYELRPSVPLTPGSLYRIVVDGLDQPRAADLEGERYAPRIFELRTAGEKPPPPTPVRRRRR